MKATTSGGVITGGGVCTITDAANGRVTYNWQVADTLTAADYDAEYEITWPTAKPETVPKTGYFKVYVKQDLGGA